MREAPKHRLDAEALRLQALQRLREPIQRQQRHLDERIVCTLKPRRLLSADMRLCASAPLAMSV